MTALLAVLALAAPLAAAASPCADSPAACDDGNPCTRDYCDWALGCRHEPAWRDPCAVGGPADAADVVIVVDALAPTNCSRLADVSATVGAYAERLAADPLPHSFRVALHTFGADGALSLVQGFTSDPDALRGALRGLEAAAGCAGDSSADDPLNVGVAGAPAPLSLAALGAIAAAAAAPHVRPDVLLHLVAVVGTSMADDSSLADTDASAAAAAAVAQTTAAVVDAKVSLTVFLPNATGSVPATVFGQPKHAVQYPNYLGFNKRLTVDAMRAAAKDAPNEFRPLQAYLLGKNVLARVHSIDDWRTDNRLLLRSEIPRMPPMGGRPGIELCNKCKTHSCDPGAGVSVADVTCPAEADFCSPTHGCWGPAERARQERPLDLMHNVAQPDSDNWATDNLVRRQLEPVILTHTESFYDKAARSGYPTVFRNGTTELWAARSNWTWPYFAEQLSKPGEKLPELVRVVDMTESAVNERHTDRFYTCDWKVPMSNLSTVEKQMTYDEVEMTGAEFVAELLRQDGAESPDKALYYFGHMPPVLRPDVMPNRNVFLTENDRKLYRQYLWISNKGLRTHMHFDADHNIFLQLSGRKKFTLLPTAEHQYMHLFPRIHPLWHKSQLDTRQPDLERFPDYRLADAVEVVLEPGDMLYVPPFTWHNVESLDASVSLSTWSHQYHVYDNMNEIYKHDHVFEGFASPQAQVYALRLFLDAMIVELFGQRSSDLFVQELLRTRFKGLETHFPVTKEDETICPPDKIPTAKHLFSETTFDASRLLRGFWLGMSPEQRDILFADYLEEMVADIVGVERTYAFLYYCFQGQEYELTERGTKAHELWKYVDDNN